MNIYINDFSITSVLGRNKEETISSLRDEKFSCSKLVKLNDGNSVRVMRIESDFLQDDIKIKPKFNSRNNRLLLNSYLQIQDRFEVMRSNVVSNRIGVILGTTSSGIGEHQSLNYKNPSVQDQYIYSLQVMSNGSDFLSDYLDIDGPSYTISSACSSSGRAFYEAQALIESGECDLVLVGGVDTINDLALNGFNSLGATTDLECTPFSTDNHGINIGEGAALFILSKSPSPYAFLGAGESSDGFHISSPEPSGKGAKKAIENCLRSSGLSLDMVSYINLHGTGTKRNDEMEGIIIDQLFNNQCNYSSTKSLTGHTLGAASAIEAAISLLILENMILNNHTSQNILDFKEIDGTYYSLSMSYGFGGNNICLAFGVRNER